MIGPDFEEALVIRRRDKYRIMDRLLSSVSNITEGLPSCASFFPYMGLHCPKTTYDT
jgi:hypothetical protein